MSVEVTLKTLKGETFKAQVNPADKVSDLKAKVAQARPELPVECQKLILCGKILVDDATIEETGYQSANFIVAMATKAKAPAAAAPTPTPAPAPAPAAAPTPAPAPPTPAVVPLNEDAVQSLCEMGFPRDQVEPALRAANGNPSLAVEFLMSGIPAGVGGGDAGGMAGAPAPIPTTPGDSEPMPEVLEQLRSNPQFGQLAALIASNPQMLGQVMQGVQQSHPEIAQAIQQHPEAFMRLLHEATGVNLADEEGDPRQDGELAAYATMLQQHPEMLQELLPTLLPEIERQDPQAAAAIRENPQLLIQHMMQQAGAGAGRPAAGMPGVIRLTEEENAAVERLAALGFDKEMAAQAYLACDKSEELAANFLFDNAGS
mmetsp:Transcript_41935/g.99898  ORF Transcript_41935/g.99898 Transcript_41935/m.99898 type:complete len:373 (+) Transcript_41935:83-1201(+)|eukprot:CAMPEP_0181453836 /NCGR_PEP_ID=MMETSP1110-20121109/29929_1 /TAXON_ID=174948 /ORGANISM="Symbiodinium sp., Strain CCMP421" /LENGTH=372 /DNA_ID=CAMNT_0023578165 /DNA_START=67 /DNA_END=1185 /DNA_ORIENTATION=-